MPNPLNIQTSFAGICISLVEKRYCTKRFLQKESDFRESYVYFFRENVCGKGLLPDIKKEPSSSVFHTIVNIDLS